MSQFKVKCYELVVSDITETYLKQPEAVLGFIADDFDYNERMILLGMNVKNKVLVKKDISIGGYNTLLCTPADIFIPCLLSNARSFILIHNHPSTDCQPSKEDIIFTKKVEKASELIGLSFIDHIIVNNDMSDNYSFKKNGII